MSPFDVLITGGRIIDGTGGPWFHGDIGLHGDRITAIGRLAHKDARLRLDAAGKVVAPGLIDAHVHGDLALFTDPLHEPAIRQGVTTYVIGQDGVAMAPASPETLEYMCRYTAGFSGGAEWLKRTGRPTWSSVDEYLKCFDRASAVNVVTLVPNGNVRLEVMGLDTRPPRPDEIKAMQRLVREGMEQGAVGLSSGLDYIPSRYAAEAELAELCKAIAPYDGVYITHMRGYMPAVVLASMDEVYNIGRAAGCGVHISHFNSRADIVVPKMDAGRAEGVDVTFDLYCYLAGSSIVGMYTLPAWAQEGGIDATLARLKNPATWPRLRDWFVGPNVTLETVRISYVEAPEWKRYEGMTLPQAAGSESREQIGRFVLEVLIASGMAVGCVVPHRERGEADVVDLIRHPCMMGGSDGIFTGSRPHPRGCGCYARYLGHYVRNGTWTLETAVQRLAGTTARRFGLRDRGLLREGLAADVIVFDPATVGDLATFEDGAVLAVGMEHVIVNGEVVLLAGQRTDARPGRGLRRA